MQVLPDPRLDTTASDYQAQFELLIQIRDQITKIRDAVSRIRDLRQQVANLVEGLREADQEASIKEAANSVTGKLTEIEQLLVPKERGYERDDLDYALKLIQQF